MLEPDQPVCGCHRQLSLHSDRHKHRRCHWHKLSLLRRHLSHVSPGHTAPHQPPMQYVLSKDLPCLSFQQLPHLLYGTWN